MFHSSDTNQKIGINLDQITSIESGLNPDGGTRLFTPGGGGFIDVNEEFSEVMEAINGINEWGKM